MISVQTITYPIVETFHSVQGEGAWTGVNAFFIRLAGCDVHCSWCDTKESWNEKRHPQQDVQEIVKEAKAVNPAIVVVTGGEPLIHNLEPLTRELHNLGLRVHLETSGAHPFSGMFDWVTFSPKSFKLPHSSIYSYANELKIVVATERDLQWAEQQAALVPSPTLKYLQPEWNTLNSKDLVFNYVVQHSQWRISLQTHKLLAVH
jgi:organic radical activating enzyme